MDYYWKVNLFLVLCHIIRADSERCAKTAVIKNGSVRYWSRGGFTAVFACNPGYALRGTNVSHCQTDGHWSAPPPSCVQQGERLATSEIITVLIDPAQYGVLNCSVGSTGENGTLFWTENGNFVQSTSHVNGTLALSTNKNGTYVCLFYSEETVKIVKAIKIKYLPEALTAQANFCNSTFKEPTSMLAATSGSEVTIFCNAGMQNITWLKNGATLTDKNVSNFKTHLSFHLTAEREGNYTCLAKNKTNKACLLSKTVIVRIQNPINALNSFACGNPVLHRTKRIIDGSRASPLSAPWMCMLSLDREPSFCGCSLISSRWIATAAHCFKKTDEGGSRMMSQEEIKKKIRVKFGKQQRRQVEKGEIVRNLIMMVAHPKYKPISSSQNTASEHDIAIAKLDAPVIFQSHILPICLPPPGFVDSLPKEAFGVVTGWGRVSVRDSVMALTLQEAYLPLVNRSSCQLSTNYAITENMLCAGYAESYKPDTCFGDSGGPFILQQQNRWFLAGIVSWGEGCSSPKKFGIYTNVEKYVPWIHSTWEQDLNK